MNLLSPGDIFLAVRRRSVCSVVVTATEKSAEEAALKVNSAPKKDKKRRNSLSEPNPTRRPSFFQRCWKQVALCVDRQMQQCFVLFGAAVHHFRKLGGQKVVFFEQTLFEELLFQDQ